MASPRDDLEPIPGESRLALVATSVLLGFAAVAVIAAVVASILTTGMGGVVVATLLLLAVAVIGFLIALGTRRNYLRDVRNGRVVVRRPWRGESLSPPD